MRHNRKDRIKSSNLGLPQLAQQVNQQFQQASHAVDEFIDQNSSVLAKAGLISGALALAVLLLQRKRRDKGEGTPRPPCTSLSGTTLLVYKLSR